MQVYAFGGYNLDNNFAESAEIDEFDPATQTWTKLAPKLHKAR